MVHKELQNIFGKVQLSSSCHQKCVIVLSDLYKKTPRDEFLRVFLLYLQTCCRQIVENNIHVKRLLDFISRFCADITKKEERETETHEFLTAVLEQALQWSTANLYDMRYHTCYFIAKVLQDIGEDVQLEINLIDAIQIFLLERMAETKIPIRSVAMSALVRLQEPQNFECPVINAFICALTSASASIRKEATEKIAPNTLTLGIIKDRIRDSDPSVRAVAFHKCADIGPLSFRISEKHVIMACGFCETHEKVKSVFVDYLLPKWLTAYKGDYLKFVGALKLIADEEDIKKMFVLAKNLIGEFYRKHSLDELITALPINENKVVDIKNLNNDVTIFWNILTGLLRDADDMDERLNEILPELTPFCHYIENLIHSKAQEHMDEWRHFEYQFDLLNLFEIAENYDFSDEVGRRTVQTLTVSLLHNHQFTPMLTKKLVTIAHKCSSNVDFFTQSMCELISDIREPPADEPLSEDERREINFKVAEIKVKINILKERHIEAVSERDYQRVQQLDVDLSNFNKQLESLQSRLDGEKVRTGRSDNETLCRCLDILASVLELPAVSKLTPSLTTCRDHFLLPLFGNQGAGLHWRLMRCLGLFSVIDKPTAEQYAKLISVPVSTYRTVPINNVSALVQSICSVTDLITLYGFGIVSNGEEATNLTSDQNSTKRKLYTTDSEDDTVARIDHVTVSSIFEIFLDMLDDERDEIRHRAVLAIGALINNDTPVTPTLLSRILLKWYSPLTARQDSRLQICLGFLIERYMLLKNSCEVLKEAVIPTLMSIIRAPGNSPLADIDIDNVLLFFSEMMNVNLEKDDLRILALDLCMKITEKTNTRLVPYLIKLLCYLDIQRTNVQSMTELTERVEQLLENGHDKITKRNLEKFVSKLRQHSVLQTDTTIETTQRTTANETEPEQPSNALRESNSNVMKEPQQVKRRKSRNVDKVVVVLERMNFSQENQNETTLHTINEASMEMEIDENLTIDTPTTDTSKSSKGSGRSNIVISETSDSDFSTENEMGPRRSNRCRKKRIIN